jgi:hypothetical protein
MEYREMNDSKNLPVLLGIGFAAGMFFVVVLLSLGYKLIELSPLGFKFGVPTDIPATQIVNQPIATLQAAQPTSTAQVANTARSTNTPIVSIPKSQWPTSPLDASNFFANGKGQWEINEYGGWHLIPQWPPIEIIVPLGVTLEAYNDGPSPPQTRRCMTVFGPAQVAIQGGTFWFPDFPENPLATARKIYKEQSAWTAAQGGPARCEAFGFQP